MNPKKIICIGNDISIETGFTEMPLTTGFQLCQSDVIFVSFAIPIVYLEIPEDQPHTAIESATMNRKLLAVSLSMAMAFLCAAPTTGQISLGTVDDFTIASTNGWTHGGFSNLPTHNTGAGLDGLAGHLQNISDGAGSGGRWFTFNSDARWMGDYVSAGVSVLEFDFDNRSGNGTGANLRIALNGPGGWFISDDMLVADGTGWQTMGFDLLALNHLSGGSGVLTDTLSSATRLEILSSVSDIPSVAGPGFVRGDQLIADFRIDNIRAVPEPGALVLIVMSALGLVVLRRK